jgi:hypothetical protein
MIDSNLDLEITELNVIEDVSHSITQNDNLSEEEQEVNFEDMLRSLIVISEAWESNKSLYIEDMCDHLEALMEVVDFKLDFSGFLKKTQLINKKYLN